MRDQDKTRDQLIHELEGVKEELKNLKAFKDHYVGVKRQLYNTNEFLRNILESSSSISIVSTDLDHNIVYWNRGAENIFGYKAEEVVGKEKIDILYPDGQSQALVNNIRDNLFSKKKGITAEIIEVTKKGHKLWISMNLTPRFDRQGNIIGILGIGEDITRRKSTTEQLKQSLGKLQTSLKGIIHVLELTVEARDPYTAGHQRRVSNLALAIAKEMGMGKDQLEGLRLAGIIHDLGKLTVPAEILSNPGHLSEIQFSIIKTHPQVGFDILKGVEFPWPIATIMLQHHEKLDGSGYPLGIKDEDILLESKILAVADVVEAMASHRPYRASLGLEKALREIEYKKNVHYQGDVVDACIKLFKEKGYNLEHEIELELSTS